jgi:hypothetical protein
MKTLVRFVAVSSLLGASALLMAQPPLGGGGQGGQGGQRGPRPTPAIVTALDANQDGVIDAGEIKVASEALGKLDKNNDGKLTLEEYMGPRPGGQGGGRDQSR